MRLDAYVEREGKGSLSRLARESGLAYSTVFNACKKGALLKEYATAKKLSDATVDKNGVPQVTVAELCEPAAQPASSDSGEHEAVDPEAPANGTAA